MRHTLPFVTVNRFGAHRSLVKVQRRVNVLLFYEDDRCFLRAQQSVSFMKSGGSLLCSEEPINDP